MLQTIAETWLNIFRASFSNVHHFRYGIRYKNDTGKILTGTIQTQISVDISSFYSLTMC